MHSLRDNLQICTKACTKIFSKKCYEVIHCPLISSMLPYAMTCFGIVICMLCINAVSSKQHAELGNTCIFIGIISKK